jgi:hypothetical protein
MGDNVNKVFNCPDCKTELDRKLGLPAVVLTCAKCNRDWVKCIDILVPKEEFHDRRGNG